jgi:MFS superfamily sulfate permease-like transporter
VSGGAFSGTLRKFGLTLWDIADASWQTTLVSIAVLTILIVFARYVKAVPGGLVAVIGAIAASWIFDFAAHGVSTLGPVPSGMPHIGFPHGVTWSDTTALIGTAASMFLVILAQSAATARAYAVKYRESFDEGTDLVGLSLANLAAGFSSTFVVNGSPTKTEMVDEAKSHTEVAQLSTAVVVAVVLLFLTRPLQYLPNCVLSSVVFLIGVKLIDVEGMKEIYRLRRDEFYVALLTALVVVTIGVEEGIILAIVLSIVLHVRRHYLTVDGVLTRNERGNLKLLIPTPGTVTEPGLIVFRFGGGVFYANATRLSEEVLELVEGDPRPRWFVLDAGAVDDLDFTGGKTLAELTDQLHARGVVLALSEVNAKVRSQLDSFGVTAKVGEEHIYETIQDAVEAFHAASPPAS